MSMKSTIQAISEAGFGYIKVELEAQLGRPYDSGDDGEYVNCSDCDGAGNHSCDDCNGDGYQEVALTRPDGTESSMTEEVYCDTCDGDGHMECENCEGSGEVYEEYSHDSGEYGSVATCQNFILSKLSDEAKKAIIYGRFYNDGSVDSEYTFTIKLEDIKVLPEIVNSFNLLAEEIGNGMDVDGAGMHIAVLPHESGGVYPVRNFELDQVKLDNFRTEVSKLLPALFIAATSGNFTRALGYRNPKIEYDKYSAIHIVNGRCLEYRLFETCYQRPEAIFEYLETIARTLEYYKDETKKVETQGREYVFYDQNGISGFTSTPEQVRIIKKQLKMVIGKNTTIKKFQQARDIDLSVQTRNKDHAKRVTRAKQLYKEALANYEHMTSLPMTPYEEERLREYKSYGYFDDRAAYPTEQDKIAYMRGITRPGTEEQFINRNVLGMRMASAINV